MKPALIIGSTCVDVVLKIDRLPKTGDDLQPKSQTFTVGGCAYNVSQVFRLLKTPHTLITPVGGGVFGEYVRNYFEENDIPITVHLPEEENGCCYCLVEPSGERTFLSHHGAEYLFRREWFTPQVLAGVDSIYICGLELEEATSSELVDFLEELRQGEAFRQLQIFFAPGPRITSIDGQLMDRILGLSPIVHLNETEIIGFTGRSVLADAVEALHRQTRNSVVVTRGEQGACCIHQGHIHHMDGHKAVVVDTIGAGDAHMGSLIAALHQGFELPQAVGRANAVAAAVVSISGASLTTDEYNGALGKGE